MSKKKHYWQLLTPVQIDPSTAQKDMPNRFYEKEMWKNDVYTVLVNRGLNTPIGKITWLSIRRNDREAAKDWRHFQYIKNQLVGKENEGIEIYPAESRLVDGSNQFHVWVFESTEMRIPFGFDDERNVTESPVFEGAKQRPFEENMKPDDLEECETSIKQQLERVRQEAVWEKMEALAKNI